MNKIDWNKIKNDYVNGLTVTELSAKYNIARTTIQTKANDWKRKNDPNYIKEIEVTKITNITDELKEIYNKNRDDISYLILTESTADLANFLKIDEETFNGLFHKEIKAKFKKIANINKNLFEQATNEIKPSIPAAALLLKKSTAEQQKTIEPEITTNPFVANTPPEGKR